MRLIAAMTAGLVAGLVPPALDAQVPQIPATFYGAVTIDGQAPPAGTEVRGLIDGIDCTQPGAPGSISAGDVGAYVISVMHETQKPGCASEGKQVTFTIGGKEAGQSATWQAGPQELSLNAGSGSAQPLPPNVPIPTGQAASQATATLPGLPPTGGTEPAPAAQTPRPPGLTTANGDDDGRPLWGILTVALLGFGVLGGAAGFALSRRRPHSERPEG